MTMSKAEMHAEKLALQLTSLGFLKYLGNGRFRPTAVKKCGTCAFFEFDTEGDGVGKCIPKETQYGMADTGCSDHQWSGVVMEFLKAGLPL